MPLCLCGICKGCSSEETLIGIAMSLSNGVTCPAQMQLFLSVVHEAVQSAHCHANTAASTSDPVACHAHEQVSVYCTQGLVKWQVVRLACSIHCLVLRRVLQQGRQLSCANDMATLLGQQPLKAN